MANMQQLMVQAQKMKREMQKAKDALKAKEFAITKSGGVKVVLTGAKEVVEIDINEEMFDKDNKENVETLLILAFNEALKQIEHEEAVINEAITGSASGLF